MLGSESVQNLSIIPRPQNVQDGGMTKFASLAKPTINAVLIGITPGAAILLSAGLKVAPVPSPSRSPTAPNNIWPLARVRVRMDGTDWMRASAPSTE